MAEGECAVKNFGGGCFIPLCDLRPSNKPLGQWVVRQRHYYKLLKEGKNSPMTTERIDSLNELDFEWSSGKETSNPSTVWDVRLQELATYKQQNKGETNVPQGFQTNKPLGNWVSMNQRIQFKLLQDGKKSHMTTERIESLNKLDFEWSTPRKGNTTTSATWDDRLQELTIYKQPSTVWDVRLL
jgi:hypothetical protein